jgi:hypothetical protein
LAEAIERALHLVDDVAAAGCIKAMSRAYQLSCLALLRAVTGKK